MNIILLSSSIDHRNMSTLKPLGCYQLASWLRQHGYTVKVIDHCSQIDIETLESMVTRYIDDTTVAIGVSTSFWMRYQGYEYSSQREKITEPEWVLKLRTAIENKFPKIEWLLGGSYPADLRGFIKEWNLFIGNAEDSLLSYMDNKIGRDQSRKPFDIATSSMRYHDSDFIQPHESVSIETGRGCQFKCKFCQYPNIGKKKGTYLRSIDCIHNDLLYNYERFGITRYSFIDDTVNEDYEKIVALANMAQKLPFELEWVGYNRADLIWSRPETIQILKDSGLKSAFFGIESFGHAASKLVGKGWFGKYAQEFILELRDRWGKDVSFFMSFIAGLEGDTEQSVVDTAHWLIKNNFYSWTFNPLRVTRLAQTTGTTFKSEFEINHTKYGYRFPHPLNDVYWESNSWNVETASKVAAYCINLINAPGTRIAGGFDIFQKTNVGYSTNYAMWTQFKDYDWKDDVQRIKNFVDNYVNKTLTSPIVR